MCRVGDDGDPPSDLRRPLAAPTPHAGGFALAHDSGDLTRYEGVMDGDPVYYDPHYWHPDGVPAGAGGGG